MKWGNEGDERGGRCREIGNQKCVETSGTSMKVCCQEVTKEPSGHRSTFPHSTAPSPEIVKEAPGSSYSEYLLKHGIQGCDKTITLSERLTEYINSFKNQIETDVLFRLRSMIDEKTNLSERKRKKFLESL